RRGEIERRDRTVRHLEFVAARGPGQAVVAGRGPREPDLAGERARHGQQVVDGRGWNDVAGVAVRGAQRVAAPGIVGRSVRDRGPRAVDLRRGARIVDEVDDG